MERLIDSGPRLVVTWRLITEIIWRDESRNFVLCIVEHGLQQQRKIKTNTTIVLVVSLFYRLHEEVNLQFQGKWFL